MKVIYQWVRGVIVGNIIPILDQENGSVSMVSPSKRLECEWIVYITWGYIYLFFPPWEE
jgi:hypothetical protein